MKKLIFGVLSASFVLACKSTKTQNTSTTATTTSTTQKTISETVPQGPYIIKVGNKITSPEEFKYVYEKNNQNSDSAYSLKNINEYLNLYTNFRLKVAEAESLGYDTVGTFIKELDGYKKQLAQPYLKEKGVNERLIKESYERLKENVNASHILIRLAEDAEPKDTLVAYNKIMEIRDRVVKGEDFGKLAVEFSQDPSAKDNKGNLNYFTALQMVYPFEQAAFNTKVGDVSMPVRTKFGYHILKVNNRRPSQGTVVVAHIWARYSDEQEKQDSIEAVKKINEIYKRLQKGEKWDELCNQFSDDSRTAKTGGVLAEFGVAQMVPSFEDAAFGLKKAGEYTKPVRTPYGWHIIKLLEKKPLAPFETMEPTLKTKVSKDSRSDLTKLEFLKRIKVEDKFIENKNNLEVVFAMADSNLANGAWSYDEKSPKATLPIFTINNKPYLAGEFFKYVKTKQRAKKGHTPRFLMEELYKEYADNSVISYEEANLETKYPEYKMLVKEYRDGILLFQIMDENVWNKAVQDTAGQRKYFENNKESYKWAERVEATVYNCANKEILEKVKEYIKKPLFPINEDKPVAIYFEKNVDTLDAKAKSSLDQLIAQILRDKNLSVEIQLASLKTESNLGAKRIALIKKAFEDRKIAANRFNIVDNGNILTTEKAYFGYKVYSASKQTIEKLLNVTNALNLKVQDGKFQKGDNEFVDATTRTKGEYTLTNNDRIQFIQIRNTEAPRNKYFEECKGAVISDYQNYLEKEWLAKLKQKFTVTIDQQELNKLVK